MTLNDNLQSNTPLIPSIGVRASIKCSFFGVFLLLIPWPGATQAQHRYWVAFKDKPGVPSEQWTSQKTLAQRQQQVALVPALDAPVHPAYLDSLVARGLYITGVSKWLNAAAVQATPAQITPLQKAGFVQAIRPITGYLQPSQRDTGLPIQHVGQGVLQLKPGPLFTAGLTGKGVKIGIIDAGFYQAPEKPDLRPIFEAGRVKAYRDFINPAPPNPYSNRESLLDFHGTEVMRCIGGYDPVKKLRLGLAPNAEYYLARTDHGGRENRIEEENFVRALEWLDSLGVRLINASLGYTTGFDNPAENYRPEQMDGTSFIARAVQLAIEKKGMTIIVSAGNDGNQKNWQIIGTPADAPGAIAVGATDFNHWARQHYSGIGPAFLPYLKPDLACFATDGTSFSAPLITGLAACLLEQNPALTPGQLTDILRRSGHLYPYGNTYVGYGVPNAGRALQLAKNPGLVLSTVALVPVTGDVFAYKFSGRPEIEEKGGIVVFRKSTATQVIQQQKLSPRTKKLKLTRLVGETRTTVQIGDKVMELVWP